ncbi:hypothetical protein [Pedomonas mirosovicensis]|uniref:hypothetical protein n=1 Tax=Pedomonas mirosovicensis TaxID=2908641 RepID=UPI00216A1BEF|nr:hypothetical protein [Pedomonas mirosovicensis]MCH8684018.1 hypothetical protein [Pedomonas mirosovicensis]
MRARPVRATLAFITRSRPVFAAALVIVFLVLYFGLGGLLSSTIDDNMAFRPAEADLSPGGSVAVGMASAVLDRELNEHGWKADDPWFYPTALLDNMPAWQRGLRLGVLRFVASLQSLQAEDPDLARAAQALDYPPDRWWIGTNWPWVRTASASSYREAVEAIRSYNAHVAGGRVTLTRDAATLATLLDRMADTLAESEEMLGQHVSGDETAQDKRLGNDEMFYTVRGEAYASLLILGGLREDFEPLIRQRQLAARWATMARSLETVVALDPLIVTAGDPGSFLIKNHLMEQGFALQRTEQQIRALAAALRQAPATTQTTQTRRR